MNTHYFYCENCGKYICNQPVPPATEPVKSCANEGKDSEAVKAEKPQYNPLLNSIQCAACGSKEHMSGDCPAIEAVKNPTSYGCISPYTVIENHNTKTAPKPPLSCETFSWLEAMKLFAEGVEIEIRFRGGDTWMPLSTKDDYVGFLKDYDYRRKPLPVTPDYSLDQGFKSGNVVMCCGENGHCFIEEYIEYDPSNAPYKHCANKGCYKYARPFTVEEHARVRVEGKPS